MKLFWRIKVSNIIKLYHGTDHILEMPVFGEGKKDNDYGQGFYCTKDIELAKEWACQKNNKGYINKYSLDLEQMNVLYINSSKNSILHWISILIENREIDNIENYEAINFLKKHFSLDINSYDILVGYRADDSYFAFARDFVNDAITIQTLSKAMLLGKLGYQYVLKSKKAFDSIKYIGSEKVEPSVYYTKYKNRDTEARNKYQNLKHKPKSKGIIITEIIKNPSLYNYAPFLECRQSKA